MNWLASAFVIRLEKINQSRALEKVLLNLFEKRNKFLFQVEIDLFELKKKNVELRRKTSEI